MSKETEIAVRLYENQKYGTTYAKGKYHSALFNATADVSNPRLKYLLDFYPFEKWEHTAKSDMQMQILRETSIDANTLVSWVLRYDSINKIKQPIYGVSLFDLSTNNLTLAICDSEINFQNGWSLPVRPCKTVMGKKSPHLLATNTDLTLWQ